MNKSSFLSDVEADADLIQSAKRNANINILSDDDKREIIDNQLSHHLSDESYALRLAVESATEILLQHNEHELMKLANPTNTDELLRINFWEEVLSATKENRNITESRIYSGITGLRTWMKLRDEGGYRFAYIMTPIKEYQKMNKLLLHKGQQIILDILNANPYVGEGKKKRLDARVAKVQLEAYKLVEERMYGKAVQKIQSHNINESQSPKDVDIEAIRDEIKQLTNKNKDILEIVADEAIIGEVIE